MRRGRCVVWCGGAVRCRGQEVAGSGLGGWDLSAKLPNFQQLRQLGIVFWIGAHSKAGVTLSSTLSSSFNAVARTLINEMIISKMHREEGL